MSDISEISESNALFSAKCSIEYICKIFNLEFLFFESIPIPIRVVQNQFQFVLSNQFQFVFGETIPIPIRIFSFQLFQFQFLFFESIPIRVFRINSNSCFSNQFQFQFVFSTMKIPIPIRGIHVNSNSDRKNIVIQFILTFPSSKKSDALTNK
jgi:hypothetical protein